jgi:hypothetical protein
VCVFVSDRADIASECARHVSLCFRSFLAFSLSAFPYRGAPFMYCHSLAFFPLQYTSFSPAVFAHFALDNTSTWLLIFSRCLFPQRHVDKKVKFKFFGSRFHHTVGYRSSSLSTSCEYNTIDTVLGRKERD